MGLSWVPVGNAAWETHVYTEHYDVELCLTFFSFSTLGPHQKAEGESFNPLTVILPQFERFLHSFLILRIYYILTAIDHVLDILHGI